ncbi:MAG TPA: hypothetical protein VKC89_00250 [Patescibacteria group bacterium]|nr:hypothetical protein [Patescibacteria group bacterium]
MKGEGFIPNKDFGRGTIGPSLLDYERAGMPQFKSPDRNPFKWGKEVLKRASQSIVLAATLNGGLPANAAVPLPDVPAGINHVDNILELPQLSAEKLAALDTSLLPWDNTDISTPEKLQKQKEEVAARFGWDEESKKTSNWSPSGDGGYVFKTPDGKHHPIFIAGIDGRGVELRGWMKLKNIYGDTAIVIAHRNTQLVEVMEGTVYPHKNSWDGWIKLADEARNNRVPGQIVMPLNEAPGVTNEGNIPLFAMNNVDAARVFGVPGTWGADPNNWDWFDGGPQGDRWVQLKANPNGQNTGIKLDGAVAQGFVAADRRGTPAIPFVAHPDVDEIFGTVITLRLSNNPNALWRNSLSGMRMNEARRGTGTVVMPVIR